MNRSVRAYDVEKPMLMPDHSPADPSLEAPPRLGLALSAGGARGAYQVGAWKAFLENGMTFDAVAGSSIGALNGAFICQGDWHAALEFWTELTRTKMLSPDYRRLSRLTLALLGDLGLLLLPVPPAKLLLILKYSSSVYKIGSRHGTLGRILREGLIDLGRFRPLLNRYLKMESLRGSATSLYVTLSLGPGASGLRGKGHCLRIQDFSPEEAWQILAASMALPFVFSSVAFRGTRYIDGGISSWLPVECLCAEQCRTIFVVSTKPKVSYRPQSCEGSEITVVRPEKPLGRFPVATFRFTGESVRQWMDLGYEHANSVLSDETRRK